MQKNQAELVKWRKSESKALLKERDLLRDQLVTLRVRMSLQKEKNTASVKILRKNIARIETILKERTNGN